MCETGILRIAILIAIPLLAAAQACERMTSTTVREGIFFMSNDKPVEGGGKMRTDDKVFKITARMTEGPFVLKMFKAVTKKCSSVEFCCRDSDKNVLYSRTEPLTGIQGWHSTIINVDFPGCSDVQVKFTNTETRGKRKKMEVKAIAMRSCLMTDDTDDDCLALIDHLNDTTLHMATTPSDWSTGTCVPLVCNSPLVMFGENETCCVDGGWTKLPYCEISVVLPRADDMWYGYNLPTNFLYLGNQFDTINIYINGFVIIKPSASSPSGETLYVYQTDIDTRTYGTISYSIVTDGPLLNGIENEIVSRMNPGFTGATWVMEIRYDNVPRFNAPQQRSSFKVVLVMGGAESYIIMDYINLEYQAAVFFTGFGIRKYTNENSGTSAIMNLEGQSLIFKVDTTMVIGPASTLP